MSSLSSHDISTSVRSPSSSVSSCTKMGQLTNTGAGTTMVQSQSSSSVPPGGNIHCSIGQQSGAGAGLAPIMEIREMNSYCNWNHHPHANVSRHVYPQMFYTPPPPPVPPSYPTANGNAVVPQVTQPTNDWNCAPSSVDSYSHFLYSQYPPPPPVPPQQHDYFLGISTSCYDSDMMIPGPSSQVQGGCEPVPAPVQSMMNSYMYSAPPLPSSFDNSINAPATTLMQMPDKSEKISKPEVVIQSPSTPSSTSISTAYSSEESEDEDDEESKNIISIDDDNGNIVDDEDALSSPSEVSMSASSLLCVLCKRNASLLPGLPVNAPSPQLSRILDNIDDDELDISVCSGDIEIGGIEDEMIQQATEQQQNRVSLERLSQLVGLSVRELISVEDGYESNDQLAVLCSKCQRLVGMAESLEKQLSAVLNSLRQAIFLEDQLVPQQVIKLLPKNVSSVALQTDDYEMDQSSTSVITVRRNSIPADHCRSPPQFSAYFPPEACSATEEDPSGNTTNSITNWSLCHICGRPFNCRRNLGKHLKRHHDVFSEDTREKPTCPRENCGKVFNDKAALKVHLRVHTSEKPYFCIHCLKLFTTKSNLTMHIKSNVCQGNSTDPKQNASTPPTLPSNATVSSGLPDGSNSFHCENCGLTFRSEARFQKHISTKTSCNKSKLLQCHVCLKPFAKRSELKAHQAVHTRTKSFLCDICGMAFSTRGNQRVHQRTHFDQKRFKCQFCDKGFTRNQTLRMHITNAHPTKQTEIT